MKILLILFSFTMLVNGLSAQTRITGTVNDAKNTALVGANVYILGSYDGTSTDANGHYTLITKEQGNQILCFEFLGFEKKQVPIVLINGQLITQNSELKELFNALDAVTVTAGTFEAGDRKKSIAITSIDMVTTPSATGNIFGALQALPGTTTLGESGKLYVKGGDSNESKTFIDGTLVHSPYTSSTPDHSVRGRFNPFMFNGTMFSTGGYSAEYGQALSSVLALKTNEMPEQDQLNISLLSVGAELGLTKTTNKTALTGSLKYNNLKPYMQLVPQYTNWHTEPKSVTGEFSYRQKTAKSGLLKVYGMFSQAKMTMNTENTSGETSYDLKNQYQFMNTSWRGAISEKLNFYAGASITSNMDQSQYFSAQYVQRDQGLHLKTKLTKTINSQIKIAAGTELLSNKYGIEYSDLSDSAAVQFTNHQSCAFIEANVYASKKLVFRLGTRAEYASLLNRLNWAPRISTALKTGNYSQFSLAYGWFFQNPENNYLLYAHNLNFERANHYQLSYQFEKNKRVFRSEVYFKQYQHLIKFTGEAFYAPSAYANNGYGNAKGFDLFFRDNKSIKNAEYWISYSFIDADRYYKDYPTSTTPNFASKHNVNVIYKQWIGALRSQLGLGYKYASPRYYNDPNKQEFNTERTIAYQSLDMNWSFLYRQNIIFYASVSNVLGFNQQFGYRYSQTPNAEGVYTKTPILPSSKRFYLVSCFITLSKGNNANQMKKI